MRGDKVEVSQRSRAMQGDTRRSLLRGNVLKVVLTIDTEVWPRVEHWPQRRAARPLAGLDEAYEQCILGRTPQGDYGLPYLLQSLNDHGLHGVFFVESL